MILIIDIININYYYTRRIIWIKKNLKKITTKMYEEYGFVKKGKYFYLELDDVIICSGFNYHHNVTYLAYNFSIKAIHSIDEFKLNDMFEGFEIQMYFDKNAQGYHKKEICFEKWSEEYYKFKLNEILHYYLDPYKNDALNYIKKCYEDIGTLHDGEIVALSYQAKDFLKL